MHAIAKRLVTPPWRALLFAVILASVTIVAYKPAWNGGFVWDDDDYVTDNELLTAPDGLRRIWFSFDAPSQYFPLVYTMFRIERALWGLDPTGYHWVNLLLHVANALLVWRLLVRLKIPGATLAAAIFSLHPVQVESVAWITERKNVLMVFFFLLSLLAWIGFVDQASRRRWVFYFLALGLYALALFAKTTALTLPVALVLVWWLQKAQFDRRRILQVLPFVLLGIGAGLLTVWWERYHQGTSRAIFPFLNPLERILVASRAIWFYLGKLLWPAKLTFIYPRWNIDGADPVDYAWLLAVVAAGALIYFARGGVGRGLEVAAMFFVATLAPVLGFIMLYTFRYTFVADHYQYLACLGPIALISAVTVKMTAPISKGRQLVSAVAVIVIAFLAVLTFRQSTMYANIEALWRTTLKRNPDCWLAHNNLGVVLFHKGALDEAIRHYQATLRLEPDYGDAEYNLGNALLYQGRTEEAILHCEKALALQPNDPDTHVAFANALLENGRIDEAVFHYGKALTVRPYYFIAQYGLAQAFLRKRELDAAIVHGEAAVMIQPQHADAHTTLAIALEGSGRGADAIPHYEKALAVSPESISAANNFAWLLATSSDAALRNGNKAVELAERADRLSGSVNPTILRTLAAAHAESGRFAVAIDTARAALRLAHSQGDQELINDLRQDLALYQAGRPFRESVGH